MKILGSLCIALGLLALSARFPLAMADNPHGGPPTAITWSEQDTYQMTGSSWNWFGAKQLAANYVGPGTDGVTYSDWRLPTRAEYQAGVTAGITGQWSAGGSKWTSESKGAQQSWTAQFTVDASGQVPSQTVQFAYYNSTYSSISAKFVRP